MQLLHPYMPFITEEVFHLLAERGDDLCVKQFSDIKIPDASILQVGALLKEAVTAIRDTRNKNQIKPKEEIKLHIQTPFKETYQAIQFILGKQVNAKEIFFSGAPVENAIAIVSGKDKFFIETGQVVDPASQKEDLVKELAYLKGFIVSVDKKLDNEKFIQNAKAEVIELERKKKADAETKLKVIEESLANL